MAKKAAKGGKKKKHSKTQIQAYDLETISKNELKKYIASLEKELTLMRQDCAFHTANKDRVMEFLYAKRDSLLCLKQESVVKNTIIDDRIEQLRALPRKKNEKTVIDDREEIRNLVKNNFEGFVSAKSAEIDHIDEEHALKRSLAGQYKRFEFDEFLYEMTQVDANQGIQNVAGDLETKHFKTMENMLLENTDELLKLNQEFTTDKIKLLTTIWNADSPETTEAISDEIKRMQDFFHEIAFNNAEVIKMLRDKLSNLMRESNKIELSLKQIRMENTNLKRSSQSAGLLQAKKPAPFSTILQSKRNFESEKTLIDLQYTNGILSQYLHMIDENLKSLKKQFTRSLRKVYQKADYKTLLIEEQILSMLRNESIDPEEDSVTLDVKWEPVTRETRTGRTVNVLNLNFENSNTLFVPPIYHEFWNPRVKYLKK